MAGGHSGGYQTQRRDDMAARDMASRALTLIEAHIDECNRRSAEFSSRYGADTKDIKDGIETLHGRVSGLSGKMTTIIMTLGGSLIVGLIAVIGFLLVYGPPWRPFIDPS